MRSPKAVLVLLLLAMSVALPMAVTARDGASPAHVSPQIEILDPRVINATYTSRIPIIDGEVGVNEWTAAGSSSALSSARPPAWQETGANITGSGIGNDSDASHTLSVMYDEEYLYLLFNVSDDSIWVDDYPANMWLHDSIEVLIDGALDKDPDQRTDAGFQDGDTFSVPADGGDGLSYSADLLSQYARHWGRNDAWFSATTNHTTYYIVEMEIRLNSIWSPKPASTIGFDTAQNDDDDGCNTVEGRLRWQGQDGYDMARFEPAWGSLYMRTYVEADAGTPQDVVQGTVVVLDGSRSRHNHPDWATAGNYTWTLTYGGSRVTLYGERPGFRFDIPGDYTVSLSVTDGTGVHSADTVRIGVRDTEAPKANAGPDVTVDQGETVALDAGATTDNSPGFPQGANFSWTFVDNQVVHLYGAAPSYTFRNAGEIVIRLKVTDATGNGAEDTMTVTVLDVEPPVAVAGPDITVDDGQPVTLDGTLSTDNMGVERYLWSFILRGREVNLTGRSTVYKFPAPGVYLVNLTVSDYDGNSATDSMTVTVVDITLPQSSAGESRTFNEGTEVALDGSLSFDNVGIASYDWTISMGGAVIARRTGEKPRYNFTSPGLYDITLQVTDGVGLQSSDTVQYRVVDVTRPHADAGGDRALIEDAPETFSAINSTDNVGIIDYNWTIERAGAPRVRRSGVSFSYNFTEPGSYTVTLTVTDAAGNWGSSAATVTVRDVTRPVAVAPRSIKINVGQTVVLDGRASQDNVGIVRYEWNYTELGVPIEVTGANVTRVFDAAANYTIRLTVYDAAGNEGTSTFYVDVVKPKAKDKQPGFGALLAVAAVAAATAALVAGRRSPQPRHGPHAPGERRGL